MLAKLYWQFTDKDMLERYGEGKWLRLAFVHAHSYEEALHKLLTPRRIGRIENYGLDDRFFLVWADGQQIDVTPAVLHKLHDLKAKEIYHRTQKKMNKTDYRFGKIKNLAKEGGIA